jgi:hypothetical protein
MTKEEKLHEVAESVRNLCATVGGRKSLSKITGISHASLCNMASGKTLPSKKTVKKLIAADVKHGGRLLKGAKERWERLTAVVGHQAKNLTCQNKEDIHFHDFLVALEKSEEKPSNQKEFKEALEFFEYCKALGCTLDSNHLRLFFLSKHGKLHKTK